MMLGIDGDLHVVADNARAAAITFSATMRCDKHAANDLAVVHLASISCGYASMGSRASDIGGEIDQFVEQHAGPRQHALDLVGRIADRALRRVEHELGRLRRLVVFADPGET